ncbi:MAG: aminoacyl-tRNA hydrolase [Flavobacteriales bacterium]|jgi:ribosome-associated protein|nr:aminoacyl-tRNA hydrolase [Flavobacteriales bacterium]MBT6745080.1 aminoacyl-tRNA hydrolase [Flavobacteriales bacterium]
MNRETIIKELIIKTSRSGGAGGQNVNKTETRVELFFDVHQSEGLSVVEKKQLFLKIKSKLIKGKLIRIVSQESRSQLTNKETAIEKLLNLIIVNTKVQKRRRATKIPYSKIQRRLSDKKKQV